MRKPISERLSNFPKVIRLVSNTVQIQAHTSWLRNPYSFHYLLLSIISKEEEEKPFLPALLEFSVCLGRKPVAIKMKGHAEGLKEV